MSESQTKAGNQECFEKRDKLSLLLLLSLLGLMAVPWVRFGGGIGRITAKKVKKNNDSGPLLKEI